MWQRLQSWLPTSPQQQLTIEGYGQKTCGLPFEEIKAVMKWLWLSLMAAGYQARAHIIWDQLGADIALDDVLKTVLKTGLKRHEPIFLYRCGDRPMQPPTGYYWRLMSEYPSLRVYQLERKTD